MGTETGGLKLLAGKRFKHFLTLPDTHLSKCLSLAEQLASKVAVEVLWVSGAACLVLAKSGCGGGQRSPSVQNLDGGPKLVTL